MYSVRDRLSNLFLCGAAQSFTTGYHLSTFVEKSSAFSQSKSFILLKSIDTIILKSIFLSVTSNPKLFNATSVRIHAIIREKVSFDRNSRIEGIALFQYECL